MSTFGSYDLALADMTNDPFCRYEYEGNIYRVIAGGLQYNHPDGWRTSSIGPHSRGEWHKHTSRQLELNICSGEIPAPARNPNPKKAYGATKPSLGLIPPVALLHEAMAFEDGASKYDAFNWRKDPVEVMTYVHAALRHLQNYADGEEYTSDTGVHNLGAVRACCGILLDSMELGILIDNRPPPGKSSEVQERLRAQKQARGK